MVKDMTREEALEDFVNFMDKLRKNNPRKKEEGFSELIGTLDRIEKKERENNRKNKEKKE